MHEISLDFCPVRGTPGGGAGVPGARHWRRCGSRPACRRSPQADLKEWLTYLASDQLQGRPTYTEGLGLAASYIAEHLKAWGVKPAGDDGSLLPGRQGPRRQREAQFDRHRHGERPDEDVQGRRRRHVPGERGRQADDHREGGVRRLRPQPAGGRHRRLQGARCVGQDRHLSRTRAAEHAGRWSAAARRARAQRDRAEASGRGDRPGDGGFGRGGGGPDAAARLQRQPRRLRRQPTTTGHDAGDDAHAAGGIAGVSADRDGDHRQRAGATPARPRSPRLAADAAVSPPASATSRPCSGSTTRSRRRSPRRTRSSSSSSAPPARTTPTSRRRRTSRKRCRRSRSNATITINVDADYTVVQTRLTRNVVGIIPGTDAKLRDSYVMFGAHYDHVGYQQTPPGQGRGGGGGGATLRADASGRSATRRSRAT